MIDTNVFIALEPYAGKREPRLAPAAQLIRLAGEKGHKIFVHPATEDDLREGKGWRRLAQQLAELAKSKPHLDLSVQIWYSKGGAIHISSDDPRLIDENGNRKGLNVAISATRQPKTFRRVDALLQREGITRR